MKSIVIINGSAATQSSNSKLIEWMANYLQHNVEVKVFNDLRELPHFNPELSIENTPSSIVAFRSMMAAADGVIISTPEYVFSIPSGLKNAIEWCVSTTVFTDKPMALITASAHGIKGHEELQLIMKTVMAKFTQDTTLLISGIKGKMNSEGELTDAATIEHLTKVLNSLSPII